MKGSVKELLRQLQNRHVPRTAVLYLGAGWVALEFIGFVVDNYGFDRTLLDASLFLIIIGFLVALVVSWFHGAGGRQPVTRGERAMVGSLLLIAAIGSGWLATRERPETRSPQLAPIGLTATDLGDRSLAVLPLANRTGVDSLDWLGPGLADMLTTNLAQFSELRVVSAQRLLDLMRQAGQRETDEIPDDLALQIASQSGARTLLRGSFIAVDDEIRLDVQLIDLEDGTVAAAERSRGSDVFALVDDVSAKLSGRLLGPAFTPTELTPVTQLATGSLSAFRAYQEALLAERRFLLEDARSQYRRAVELDSTFAIAWLRLGMQANTGAEAIAAFQNADRFKENASERDRLMIEAMFAANLQGNGPEAERILRQIIERYPEEKDARYQLGVFYDSTGRTEQGRRILEEAVALDPFFAPAINHLAYIAGRSGDSIAADTLSLRYLEIEPGQANPYDSRGEILEMIGRSDDARDAFRAALRADPAFLPGYQHLVRSYLRDGAPAQARAALEPYLNSDNADAAVLAWQLQADTYVAEGRYREGLTAYRRAAHRAAELDRDDLRIQPLVESANLATFLDDYARAEREFNDALAIDPLNGGAFLGLLVLYGQQAREDRMLAVQDSGTVLFEAASPVAQRQIRLLQRIGDAFVAFYQEDPATAAEIYDEIRDSASVPRPVPIGGVALEALALIESGRAREALDLMNHLQEMSLRVNRMDPWQLQAALYMKARAYEELGEPDHAIESYQKLVDWVGPAVREISFMRDAPDRLATLQSGEGSADTG